jgi:single-stranded-DNA-specific exonuclease
VFVLGPRINAAGRIEHGKQAVELLLSHGLQQAEEIGNRVNETNVTRQGLDKQITTEALELIDSTDELREAWSTVLFHPEWHKGVIGIVASRLIETHYRPTIVLTESHGKATGSARSVKGFDVYEAISACSDLLDQFGGHTYAAGLTMPVDNVPAFRERFERFAREHMTDEMRIPEEEVDIEVQLAEINDRLLYIVEHMAPYGPHNMRPVFLTRGVVDTGSARIVGEDHLKLSIAPSSDPKARRFDAIAFKQGKWLEHIKRGDPFSILYTIESNEWQGRLTLQLNIKDIKAGVEGLLMGEDQPSVTNIALAL